jgi:uncharacterized membrane protein YedE/YeeE
VTPFLLPLLGGVLIGLSATLLLLFNGRVAGISGIVGGLLQPVSGGEGPWRLSFVGGLLGGGVLLYVLQPSLFGTPTYGSGVGLTVAAGLLVGFGTRLGSGCTSGHGICGMARGSKRSLAATMTFMITAIATVFVLRTLTGGVS